MDISVPTHNICHCRPVWAPSSLRNYLLTRAVLPMKQTVLSFCIGYQHHNLSVALYWSKISWNRRCSVLEQFSINTATAPAGLPCSTRTLSCRVLTAVHKYRRAGMTSNALGLGFKSPCWLGRRRGGLYRRSELCSKGKKLSPCRELNPD
jgi:hypothetical protein